MLRRFWRQKKKDTFIPQDRLTITTEESITLQIKASGQNFTFSIGKDDNGTYYALTDPYIIPKFCFPAETRDEAYTKGIDAVNFYIENHLT